MSDRETVPMTSGNRQQIMDQLLTVFERASNGRAKTHDITANSLIQEDLGLYSLDLLELQFEIEEVWQIHLSEKQALELRTVGELIELIDATIAADLRKPG